LLEMLGQLGHPILVHQSRLSPWVHLEFGVPFKILSVYYYYIFAQRIQDSNVRIVSQLIKR
jgi:hypothetical protein